MKALQIPAVSWVSIKKKELPLEKKKIYNGPEMTKMLHVTTTVIVWYIL